MLARRYTVIELNTVLGAIAKVREDWQPEDLLKVEAPVALILADVLFLLGLSEEHLVKALGGELLSRLQERGILTFESVSEWVLEQSRDVYF